nr:IS5 family transposase [uncultured Roseibium sp.]
MHRSSGQLGFGESFLDPGLGRNQRLDAIDAAIDWEPLDRLVRVLYSAGEGRPSYRPLTMVKALLLQQWYGLSDVRLEEALSDTLSYRRFVGLSLEDGTPDHSTISRFRTALCRHELDAALFEEVLGQLEAKGMVLKEGTLLDATLVTAQARRPGREAGMGGKSSHDPDADWTRKNGRSHFGYKAHVAVDQGSGVIRQAILTPAKTSESEVADDLICGDEQAVYADKAYEHKERRARLKAAGIKDRVMHRNHRYQAALPYWQKRRNALIAPIRAAVERVFGTLKRSYGYERVRYVGLKRNATQFRLLCLAFNLKKAAKLSA